MSLSTSLASYRDIQDILDRALATANGIRVLFDTEKLATTWVSRANHFRNIDRKRNAKIHPVDHSMHGASPYDPLILRKKGAVVTIEILKSENIKVEEL